MKKLAIITSHPIQYNAPVFQLLCERNLIEIHVFYTWGERGYGEKFDPGFGKRIEWDIPLLTGYPYSFVLNTSKDPGSHHFGGIINPNLISEIEQWNADAILIFGWSFQSHLKLMRYFHGKIPVLFRGDSHLLDQNPGSMKSFIRTFFLRWVYKHADKALYVGKANYDYFIKMGFKKEQLFFAPHAIDNQRFSSNDSQNVRQLLGIDPGQIVFLFAGKLEEKKNPALLIEAFRLLNHPKAILLIVGNGPMETEIKSIISMLPINIRSRIFQKEFVNQKDMPAVYSSSDVFILPSQGPGETWGLSVNEAMASGLAIIVSDKCGCSKDLVVEGENGFVFKSQHVISLMESMREIIHSKNLIAMKNKSLEFIKKWNFKEIASTIENLVVNS
jgi:glycosyltransferase involved in cell wall biosynthesis